MYLTTAVAAVNMGLALNCYNLAGEVVGTQLNESKLGLMSSIVNDGTIMGMLIASLMTPIFVSSVLGRLNSMKFGNLIIIAGCLVQLTLNLWAQIMGKFISGFGVSLVLVTMTLYVCETLPGFLIGRCLTSINLGISLGYVISSVVQALTLPRPSSVDFKTTTDWRVGFCTPIIAAGINLF